MRALTAIALLLVGCEHPFGDPGAITGFDPCGATGSWTAYCESIDTTCGPYPGNRYTFTVTAAVAAFGGELTDGNGNTWGFDPGSCTAEVLSYDADAVGTACPNVPDAHPPRIDFYGPASVLIVPSVDLASCRVCQPILECAMISSSDTCIAQGDECDYRFPQQCCTGVCAGQGQGIETTFLCI